MFNFFESLVKPLPPEEPTQPPTGLYAFCRHYTKGFGVPLIIMSILTALLAMLEVSLFGFMGQLVDWLVTKNPDTLWQEESTTLITMSVIVLVIIPLLISVH